MAKKIQSKFKKLTDRQKKAADHFLVYLDKSAAYTSAFSTSRMKPQSVHRCAHELFKKPHVAQYVEEMKAKLDKKSELKLEEAMKILTDIARGEINTFGDETLKVNERIKAIERLSKMLGWDSAQKIDHGGVIFNINTSGDKK